MRNWNPFRDTSERIFVSLRRGTHSVTRSHRNMPAFHPATAYRVPSQFAGGVLGQQPDDLRIRGGEGVMVKFRGRNPAEAAMLGERLGGVLRTAEPEVQLNRGVRVMKRLREQQPFGMDGQTGFLFAFANGALPRRFSGKALAARKLGRSGQRRAGGSFAHQVSTGVFDNRDAHRQWGRIRRSRRVTHRLRALAARPSHDSPHRRARFRR